MQEQMLSVTQIEEYVAWLRKEERSPGTCEKYKRDLVAFFLWLDGAPVNREMVSGWKNRLLEENYAPVTVNSMLAALNGFFRYAGWDNCMTKYVKIQRRLFRDSSRELTRREYHRLLETAAALGRERLALLLESMSSTGVRVSEVQYLTVEAARQGRAEISMKGKIRVILLPSKLCRKLLNYAKRHHIDSGEIFITKTGRGLSRRQIWAEMKALCEKAGVEPSKVFPHNLRHLFATVFYQASKDIAKLADVLGHTTIETTRIYLMSSQSQHARYLDCLGLVN